MKRREKRKSLMLFLVIFLVFGVSWYFVAKMEVFSDLIKPILMNLFLLLILPLFIIKKVFKEEVQEYYLKINEFKDKQVKWIILAETFLVAGLLYLFMIKFNGINKFIAYDWFDSSWGVIILIELIIVPPMIFFEEFFFRGFVFKKLLDNYPLGWSLLIQILLIIIYTLIIGNHFSWSIIFLLFLVNLFLNWTVIQTKSIIVSFGIMLLLRYLIDGCILYQIKFLLAP